MKTLPRNSCAFMLATGLLALNAFAASTPGGAHLTATINNLGASSSARHYTVVWVTRTDNTFITTLWKQGASSFTSGNWTQHFPTWETQRGSSTALPAAPDGYTSATASSYTATDPSPPATGLASNPINITWNGKDASGVVVADGDYKFWIEYAEDAGSHGTDTGGLTTGGLTFTKGPTSTTVNPANRGTVGSPSGGFNFTSISIVWTPSSAVAPTITSATPTGTGMVGVPYNFTCTATGTAPITFSASGLPTGLTISSSGIISGTPTAAGTFPGTITAANGTLPNATQNFSIVISAALVAPMITSATPTGTGMVGVPYNFTCTATGTAPITFSASGLPTGLTISSSGVISGTPTAAGTFPGTITASNGTLPNATQNFSIVISAAPVAPTITSATPTGTGMVGVPYNFRCTATGTAPITFSASGLPTGLTISSSGDISGTPTAAGTFPGTITASNGTLPNATQNFSIVISAAPVAPTITSATPTGTGMVGVPYNFTCTATGTAPIGFSASGLPTGLTISSSGVISGTPTTAGTFPGTITATNGTLPNATQNFSIVISAAPVAPTITSATTTGTGTVGVPYNFTCTATGTAPIGFSASGLPTGLTISSSGVISGTPTAAGTFPGTITATNGTLPNATQNFSIVISAAPVAPTITSATLPSTGTVGVPYDFTCTATGTAPITFSASGLPTGLTISSSGVISGTPTAAGTFPGTITATNGTLPNATQNFSIVISAAPVAPTINSATPTGTGMVGVPYDFTCTATGTAPIIFSASGLPTGLTISTNGIISGTPTTAGTFPGTITATNGTLPDATQSFSIVISAAPVAPTITSATPTGTGTVGVPYDFMCTATGTAPIIFSASGLPTGLTISTNGIISGTPTTAGSFPGTITASNGTLPDATQAFSIVVSSVPPSFVSVRLDGNQLVMSGTGPANGIYAVLSSTNADALAAQWTAIATNSVTAEGSFSFTNALDLSAPQTFYRLRMP